MDAGLVAILNAFVENMALKTLCLGKSVQGVDIVSAGNDGARAVGKFLKRNHTLSRLTLGNLFLPQIASNMIGYDGAVAIAKAIKVNKALAMLDLSSLA